MEPAANLAALQELRRSPAWELIRVTLSEEIGKALVPAAISGDLDTIAIAAISRSASYQSLLWVRDVMLNQMIERERKATQE